MEEALAEYSALRTEIINRSDAERSLVNLNLTASGALAGVAAANPQSAGLMIVLPFLSAALGLLFLDHELRIHRIAGYMREHGRDPGWEAWLAKQRPRDWGRLAYLPMPTMLIFLGPAIAGLIVSSDEGGYGGDTVWVLALAVTIWFTAAAVVGGLIRFVKQQSSGGGSPPAGRGAT